MSNTADFLCQCIVHVWHYYYYCFCFFSSYFGLFLFFTSMALSNEFLSPENRVQSSQLCLKVCPKISGSGRFLFVLYVWKSRTDISLSLTHTHTHTRKKSKQKKWTQTKGFCFFGGLVLDCIATVSGVQSVVAECSLCICVQVQLHALLPPRRVTLNCTVTIMQ